MKEFDFDKNYKAILTPRVVRLLSQIHEQKQQMLLSANLKPDDLNQLVEIAKVQSIESSNRIEGIITTQDRIKKLALEKTSPKNRSENEIAGYRDVLNTIHENFEFIPLKTSPLPPFARFACPKICIYSCLLYTITVLAPLMRHTMWGYF